MAASSTRYDAHAFPKEKHARRIVPIGGGNGNLGISSGLCKDSIEGKAVSWATGAM
jgi:hypothetical protein